MTRIMYYIAFLPGGVFNGEAPPWGMGQKLIQVAAVNLQNS